MLFSDLVAIATITSAHLAAAVPGKGATRDDSSLRLIKTSEKDQGQWVTDKEKLDQFIAKKTRFVDITDIKDDSVLSSLSKISSDDDVTIQTITYPSAVAHVDEATPLIAKANITNSQTWLKTLTQFHTRYYKSTTGTEAAAWLFSTVQTVAAANPSISVKQVVHSSFNQPSVIATIPGENPNIVVIGAHFDTVASSLAAAPFPGADDNGSGTVVTLESLRVLAEAGFKPKNTLEFHFYAAEEVGLLGSQDIWSQYKSEDKPVIAFLNQDMAGYSPSKVIAVYTDFVNAALTEFVKLVAKEYTGTEPNLSQCGYYGCSDHYSATSNGFPAALVSEDVFDKISPYMHTYQDNYDNVEWPVILRHTNFTIGFLVEASYI